MEEVRQLRSKAGEAVSGKQPRSSKAGEAISGNKCGEGEGMPKRKETL